MTTAAAIRHEIETKLANRVPGALSLKIKQAPELFATGVADVDTVLNGGIPRGGITEISGSASTGKTSFGLSVVASVTQFGAACAWVDVSNSLAPESAAAAGVHLRRLLWLRIAARTRIAEKPWARLEQALQAADLLLQAGGFAVVVLDMSDVRPEHASRIPLATWYRFRLAAEQARTALVFLTQAPCAGSSAALALHCEPATLQSFSHSGETPLFEGQQYTLTRERNRNEGPVVSIKRPPRRAEWKTQTLWSRVR
jgi:hypothetical protein